MVARSAPTTAFTPTVVMASHSGVLVARSGRKFIVLCRSNHDQASGYSRAEHRLDHSVCGVAGPASDNNTTPTSEHPAAARYEDR